MGFFHPTSGPGDGLFPSRYVVRATNRSGANTTAGEIVMFDLANATLEVDNNTPGSTDASGGNNSGYNCYDDPSIADNNFRFQIFGIALEAIANDATGEVLIRGRVNAQVAAATVAGDCLVPQADGEMAITTGATNAKVVAIAEEADTANLADVLFDGIHGFGVDQAT